MIKPGWRMDAEQADEIVARSSNLGENEVEESAPQTASTRSRLLGYTEKGHPVREGVPMCKHFLEHKFCSLRQKCRYSHPGEIAIPNNADTKVVIPIKRSLATIPKRSAAKPAQLAESPDDDLAQKLYAFVRSSPGSLIRIQDIGRFYRAYPEYTNSLRGRMGPFLAQYPDLFTTEEKSGVVVGIIAKRYDSRWNTVHGVHGSQEEDTSERTVQGDADGFDGLDETVASNLVNFIRKEKDQFIHGTKLGMLYHQYPHYRHLLKGNLKSLCAKFPERLHCVSFDKTMCVVSIRGSPLWGLGVEETISILRNNRNPPEGKGLHVQNESGDHSLSGGTIDGHSSAVSKNKDNIFPDVNGICSQSSNAVRQEITDWVPFTAICVDNDLRRSDQKLYALRLYRHDAKRCAVLVTKSDITAALIRSGIPDVMEDCEIIKACYSASELAGVLYRQSGMILKGVFDIQVAFRMIFPDSPVESVSLLSMAERLNVQIPSDIDILCQGSSEDLKPEEYGRYINTMGALLSALFIELLRIVNERELLAQCIYTSQEKAHRGISCARLFYGDAVSVKDIPPLIPKRIFPEPLFERKAIPSIALAKKISDKRARTPCWNGLNCKSKDCPYKHS